MSYRLVENAIRDALAGILPETLPDRAAALAAYASAREAQGFASRPGQLLSGEGDNAKLAKGEGVRLWMLALAPAATSGNDICPHSTESCRAHCVAWSGNGMFPKVGRARVARTRLLVDSPTMFLRLLVDALDAETSKGDCAVRLNGFSDIRWERVLPDWFWVRYGAVRFYDYTKHPLRSRRSLPANYTLTYSVTERSTAAQVAANLKAGRSVAAVVETRGGKVRGTGKYRPLPDVGAEVTVVDGDENDRRFDDPAGSLVLLRRKGSLGSGDPLVQSGNRLRVLTAV